MSAFLFNLVPVPELDLNGGTWREVCIRKSHHDAMSVVGGKRKESARQKQVGLTPHAVQVDVPAQYPVLMQGSKLCYHRCVHLSNRHGSPPSTTTLEERYVWTTCGRDD